MDVCSSAPLTELEVAGIVDVQRVEAVRHRDPSVAEDLAKPRAEEQADAGARHI